MVFTFTPANPPSLAPDSPVAPTSGFRLLAPSPLLFFLDLADLAGASLAFFSDFLDFSFFDPSYSSYASFSLATFSGDSLGAFFDDFDFTLFWDFTLLSCLLSYLLS